MPDGRVYYYHRLTRQTRWDKPEGAMAEAMEQRIQDESRRAKAALDSRMRQREAEQRIKAGQEQEKDDLSKVVHEAVKKWSDGRGIHALLNDLDKIFAGAPTPSTPLSIESTANEFKRAYLQAIRVVHPDKIPIDSDTRKKLTSQEVFACVNVAYEKKKRIEGW